MKLNKNQKDIFVISAVLIGFFIFYSVFEVFDTRRYGLYHEARGDGEGYTNLNFLNLLPTGIYSVINFFIAPIKKITTLYGLMLVIDTIILYFVTFYFFKKLYYENRNLFIFWCFALLAITFIYSLIVFNDGTIHRYKLTYFIPIIFALIKSSKFKIFV